MRFYSQLPAALAILATVEALPWKTGLHAGPASSLKKRASVEGKLRRGEAQHQRSVADHMKDAYNKHGLFMSPVLASTLEGEAFNAPMDNDLFYTVPVTVGGQVLDLNLDTGSSDLWVFTSALPPQDFILPHNLYNPAFSNTSRQLNGSTFDVTYGTGFASGVVFTDNVFFGGIEAQNFPVEIATNISQQFVNTASDGLMGMALPAANTISPSIDGVPFWVSVINNLEEPLFTLDLNRNSTGAYNFGFIDETRFVGNISYLTVDPTLPFWTVNASGYIVNSTEYLRPFQGIMDTGTTLTLLPDGLLDNYFSQVPTALDYFNLFGMYLYDCSVDLPELSFVFAEGYVANIDSSYITYAEVLPGVCMSGFQPRGPTSGPDVYIFGDTFLVAQFVVLNTSPVLQVGLAPKLLDGLNAGGPSAGLNGTLAPSPSGK